MEGIIVSLWSCIQIQYSGRNEDYVVQRLMDVLFVFTGQQNSVGRIDEQNQALDSHKASAGYVQCLFGSF